MSESFGKSLLFGNLFSFLIFVATSFRNAPLDSSAGCTASTIIEMTKNSTNARIASRVLIGTVGSVIFNLSENIGCLSSVLSIEFNIVVASVR